MLQMVLYVATILIVINNNNTNDIDNTIPNNNEFAHDVAIANNYYNDVVIVNTTTNAVDTNVAIACDCYDEPAPGILIFLFFCATLD